MAKDTSNVFEFPTDQGGQTPLQIARALVDYVKDRPKANIVCIVSDPEEGSITMGWSKMEAAQLLLLIHFAKFKWERATFEEIH